MRLNWGKRRENTCVWRPQEDGTSNWGDLQKKSKIMMGWSSIRGREEQITINYYQYNESNCKIGRRRKIEVRVAVGDGSQTYPLHCFRVISIWVSIFFTNRLHKFRERAYHEEGDDEEIWKGEKGLWAFMKGKTKLIKLKSKMKREDMCLATVGRCGGVLRRSAKKFQSISN